MEIENVNIAGDVIVGDGVKIQNNVSIYDAVTLEDEVFCGPSMVFTNVINPRSFIERKDQYRPTLIKKGATLGANCTIVCGVTIGAYAFVGAGAVVTSLLAVGYSVDEILQMNANDLSSPEEKTSFPQFMEETLASGASTIEKHCVRKDGHNVWVRVNAILIRDNDGQPLHVVATIDDITRSRDSEAQIEKLNRDLSHLARGELLGQMAAGLAHELNQPLTAITQNADTALLTAGEDAAQNDELIQILKDLDQQAHRAADIIKALRNFARKGEEWKAPFELGELIDQTMRLVQPEITEHAIKVAVDYSALPLVHGIRVQIAQVLVNLLRNAIEATVGGGNRDKQIQLDAHVEGDFVVVSIRDNGPGIDPNLELFVQFETTKENGMGLGLSICRSIVEAGGGRLWYEQNKERGACFRFTIPKAP